MATVGDNPSAGAQRQTVHLVLETRSGSVFIVSSLSSRQDTQIITIDPLTGSLVYTGQNGVDLFPSEDRAVQFLTRECKRQIKTRTRAFAILGYTVVGAQASLLVVTRLEHTGEKDRMQLFGGHTVYTISESRWINIPISYLAAQRRSELKNLEELQEFPINGFHYYCETLDLTRPFPSTSLVSEFYSEFCWNEWLASSFEKIGMRAWCAVMLQGMALSHEFRLPRSNEPGAFSVFTLCLLTRKSRLNAGTRYYARGLNSDAGPGNELECELILWGGPEGSATKDFYSFMWRRGTVPVWFRSELKSTAQVGEADIIIREDPYEGAEKYYQRLLDRIGHHPITCVNLLRCEPSHNETILAEHFQQSIRTVKKEMDVAVTITNFDWHGIMKHVGVDETVRGLWATLQLALTNMGLTHGKINMHPTGSPQDPAAMACPNGEQALVTVTRRQTGLFRYNCADSLDRTNIATFYVSFQVLAEMLRMSSVGLDLDADAAASVGASPGRRPEATPRDDWPFVYKSLREMASMIDANILKTLAELFVANGDVCSTLYTNSPAAHTQHMRDYSAALPAAPKNLMISLQRRYQNVVHDHVRQSRFEMLLGYDKERYLPSAVAPARIWGSDTNSFIARQVPCVDAEAVPLSLVCDEDCMWICPAWAGVVDVYIVLKQPLYISEIGLTVRHDVAQNVAPAVMMDMFAGEYLDDLNMFFQGVPIPRCASGTRLYYNVPHGYARTNESCELYDFDGDDPFTRMPARVVRLTFRGSPRQSLALGRVEVFGMLAPIARSPAQARLEFKKAGMVQKIPDIMSALSAVAAEDDGDVIIMEDEVIEAIPLPPPTIITPGTPVSVRVDSGTPRQTDSPGPAGASFAVVTAPSAAEASPAAVDGASTAAAPVSTPQPPASSSEAPTQTTPGTSAAAGASESAVDQSAVPDAQRRVEEYKAAVQTTMSRHPDGRLFILDAAELELTRLTLGLTVQQRNAVLLSLDLRIEYFNPNRFVYPRDPRVVAALCNSSKFKSNTCATPTCRQMLLLSGHQCHYCFKRFCENCTSESPAKIIEYRWDKPQVVCKRCFALLRRQEGVIAQIKQMVEHAHLFQSQDALKQRKNTLNLAMRTEVHAQAVWSSEPQPVSVAEYPMATILKSVGQSHPVSPAVECILFSPQLLSPDVYWHAKPGVSNVELVVLLTALTVVTRLQIVVDPLGYSSKLGDVPELQVVPSNVYPLAEGAQPLTWTLSTHANAEGLIPSGSVVNFDVARGAPVRLLVIRMSLSTTAPAAAALHLGRLVVMGHPTATIVAYKSDTVATRPPTAKDVALAHDIIKPLSLTHRGGKRIVDIGVDQRALHGFCIVVRHAEEGPASQVKSLRFTCGSTDQKGEMVSQILIGRFTIPKTETGTRLYFDFENRVKGNVVTCEFLANYGGREMAPCKILLF